MEGICKRLSTECVLLDVPPGDKESIIGAMVGSLASQHWVSDPKRLVKDIMAREALASTCLGSGCAIPHAHSDTVDESLVVAARLLSPVELEAPDGQPVSLIFLLVGPTAKANIHLKLLSKLARLLHDADIRRKLSEATTAESFRKIICDREN